MGNLGSSLLESIGIGGSQGANPLAAYGGLESGEINPGMKMFGMQNALGGRGGIPETGALPSNMPTPQEAALDEAVVTGFKPDKMNFWKRLADQFLINQGQKPVMEQKVYKKNMERAMEGFTKDPLETIRRIGTFDPKTAMDLYDKYEDNQRQGVQAERIKVMMEERIRDRAAAILGAANPDNFDKIRGIAGNYLRNHGIDDSDLPTTYDPDGITAYRYGAVNVDKQIDNERLDENTESLIKSREASTRRQDASTSNLINTRNRTRSEVERHNRTMENKPRGGPANDQTRIVKTKYGNGVVSPSGKTMMVKLPNGKRAIYGMTGKDNWALIEVKDK